MAIGTFSRMWGCDLRSGPVHALTGLSSHYPLTNMAQLAGQLGLQLRATSLAEIKGMYSVQPAQYFSL